MKKSIALMLGIIVCLSCLTGCKTIVSDSGFPRWGETNTDIPIADDDNTRYFEAGADVPIADDNNTRYLINHTDRIKYFTNSGELSEAAEVIIAGKCIEANAVYKLNKLFTLSKVEVTAVYKGDIAVGDIIAVVEDGGRTSFGEYDKNCNVDEKAFETGGERLPNDYKVVVGMDGFYPMSAGEEVLLFLGDTTGFLPDVSGTLYDVVGATDGKLYKQDEGVYRKASPSDTDHYVFAKENLTILTDELSKIVSSN